MAKRHVRIKLESGADFSCKGVQGEAGFEVYFNYTVPSLEISVGGKFAIGEVRPTHGII